jgi:hypothetical protein
VYDQDLRQMLEAPLALSIRTSNIRVRLSSCQFDVNREIIESMLNSLIHWVHGNAEQQQLATDSATILNTPSSQIPVPQQQPHRTLSIDIKSFWNDFNDFSCTKNSEDFVSKIMKVNISFNVWLKYEKQEKYFLFLALLIGRVQEDILLDCGTIYC